MVDLWGHPGYARKDGLDTPSSQLDKLKSLCELKKVLQDLIDKLARKDGEPDTHWNKLLCTGGMLDIIEEK